MNSCRFIMVLSVFAGLGVAISGFVGLEWPSQETRDVTSPTWQTGGRMATKKKSATKKLKSKSLKSVKPLMANGGGLHPRVF